MSEYEYREQDAEIERADARREEREREFIILDEVAQNWAHALGLQELA
jgi:hypothetical protein